MTKIISTTHAIFTIVLALFFLNVGVKKLSKKELKPINELELVENIIDNNSYLSDNSNIGYKVTMNTMKQTGFLHMISIFQILCAILMIVPLTRKFGLLLLLPIIFNIFFIHVFMDNRFHENVETGILLLLNILLCLYYYNDLMKILFIRDLDKKSINN